MKNKKELSEDKRIAEKLSGINRLYEDLPGNKKELFCDLMKNAAFMAVALEDLQKDIQENGVVETYMNGANQYGKKQSAAMQTYNVLIKNYAGVMEKLAKQLPESVARSKLDEYMAIINSDE